MSEHKLETYHCGTTDFQYLTIALENCRLATLHTRAIGKHSNADKWEAVVVPGEPDVIAFALLFVVLVAEEEVDVANLVLECMD